MVSEVPRHHLVYPQFFLLHVHLENSLSLKSSGIATILLGVITYFHSHFSPHPPPCCLSIRPVWFGLSLRLSVCLSSVQAAASFFSPIVVYCMRETATVGHMQVSSIYFICLALAELWIHRQSYDILWANMPTRRCIHGKKNLLCSFPSIFFPYILYSSSLGPLFSFKPVSLWDKQRHIQRTHEIMIGCWNI